MTKYMVKEGSHLCVLMLNGEIQTTSDVNGKKIAVVKTFFAPEVFEAPDGMHDNDPKFERFVPGKTVKPVGTIHGPRI